MASTPAASAGTRNTDLESIWADLREGIQQIYAHKSDNMSKNRYIELYT